jgi:hypothetical protein
MKFVIVALAGAAAGFAITQAPGGVRAAALGAVSATLLLTLRRIVAAPRDDPRDEAGDGEFWKELERSRRYERPLSVVRINALGNPTDVAEQLRATLRMHDIVWLAGDAVLVALPEMRATAAEAVVGRACDSLDVGTSCERVVCFPDDALSGTALLELLAKPRHRSRHRRHLRHHASGDNATASSSS